MAITRAQASVTADGSNPTATLGSAPTEGNLLVLVAVDRSGVSHADMTPPSGWTKRVGRDGSLADNTYRRSMAIWTKVAGASESSSAQVTGGTFRLALSEYNDSDGGTWTFKEKADNDNGNTADATTIGTGTTASVADGNLLVVAIGYSKKGATLALQSFDFDNDIANEESFDAGTTYTRVVTTGYKTTTTGGTFSSTGTLSGVYTVNSGLMAAILVFDAESAAPATLEISVHDCADTTEALH